MSVLNVLLFGLTTGALLLTVTGEVCDQMSRCYNTYLASASQIRTRNEFCRITDTYLQCIKTTCHITTIPDSVMDEIRQDLRTYGFNCDLSGSGSIPKSSLYLIPTTVFIIVSSFYL